MIYGTANVIAHQLGGHRFCLMVGGTFYHTNSGNTLIVKFKMSKVANYMEITYDKGRDLYDIVFKKIRGTSVKPVKELQGVYADQLVEIFESTTGLYTKL